MNKIILFVLGYSLNAVAALPNLNFVALSGEYANNKGVAFAETAKYDLAVAKIAHNDIQVKFNKKQKYLVLADNNTSVELQFDFSFLNIFKSLSFTGVDIVSNLKKFQIFLDQLNIYIDPTEYRFREAIISADLTQVTDISDDIDILSSFLLNGDVNISEISLGQIDQVAMLENIIEENPLFARKIQTDFINLKSIPMVARNLRMVVRNKTFSGSLKLDSWINLNLYLGGNILHDTTTNQLTIELLKAKVGYFSIRKWILSSIQKLKIDNVTVDGANIIIDLEKTILTSGGKTK